MRRLDRVVADLLDLARSESGQLRLEVRRIDVSQVVQTTVDLYAAQAADAGIRVSADLDAAPVEADPERLMQVVQNLLSNALRYTPTGGSVEVRVQSGDELVLEVQDTGIGLTPRQMESLFKPFAQVHGIPEENEGTGLGLYLSNLLVQAHGGTLEAQSGGPGQGALFRVRLPVEMATQASSITA